VTAPPAEDTRVVVADRFPVTVTGPDGYPRSGCRVILTRPTEQEPGWLWVWLDTRPTPELLICTPWDQDTTTPPGLDLRQPWQLATGAGRYTVEAGWGCGCSSPLKRMLPWQPMRRGRL
jgi:hypothetical protein